MTLFVVCIRDDGDLLSPAGEESAVLSIAKCMLYFLDANYGRIVLQQHRDRKQIVHILNNNGDRLCLANFQ